MLRVPTALWGRATAVVFPGQGCQYVGMGRPLLDASPACADVFRRADEALGAPISRLCFEGPQEALDDTLNAQPAIFTVEVAGFVLLDGLWGRLSLRCVAGHSLGQFAAVVAAGAMTFEDGLLLVRERARLMHGAALARRSGMLAIVGLGRSEIARLVERAAAAGTISLANVNAPRQVVLAGEEAALRAAAGLAAAAGAEKVARLPIGAASHSPLMAGPAAGLAGLLERVGLRDARVPVVSGVDGRPLTGAGEVRDELGRQLVEPVDWVLALQSMVELGAGLFLEAGPTRLLSRLITSGRPGASVLSVTDLLSTR
jgi:[acyl-carrier-protein] S-malonyltransferase